jgi:hypothetical protein
MEVMACNRSLAIGSFGPAERKIKVLAILDLTKIRSFPNSLLLPFQQSPSPPT